MAESYGIAPELILQLNTLFLVETLGKQFSPKPIRRLDFWDVI